MPDHTRLLKSASLAALAAVALVVLSPADAPAQTSQAMRETRRTDMLERSRALRELERMKNRRPPKPPDRRALYRELAEDFKQLQIVNYSLAGVADPKVALDYARVKKESGEVRKRAARLKEYLLLPEAEKQAGGAEILTPEALRAAVGRLDALVNSFVWNPFFRKPDVFDLEQTTRASRDLVGIISLSEQIRRSADELGKSLAKK